jgi:hypothetical protein
MSGPAVPRPVVPASEQEPEAVQWPTDVSDKRDKLIPHPATLSPVENSIFPKYELFLI